MLEHLNKLSHVLGIVLLFALPCEAKPFWKSKRFWLGEAAIVTVSILDAKSTQYGLQHCPECVETSFLFPRRPSTRRIALGGLFEFGAMSGFHIASHQVLENDTRAWRFIGDVAIPALDAGIVLPSVVRNYQLKR